MKHLKQRKNKDSVLNSNCSRLGSANQALWQPNLFTGSEPKITIEPASYWEGRYSVTIRQEDCVWRLMPCLRLLEAKQLLEVFERSGVNFDSNSHFETFVLK